MKKSLVFAVFAFSASCASAPDAAQLSAADYGTPIEREKCIQLIEARMHRSLKDPHSAYYQHSQCGKGFANSIPIMGLPIEYGYSIQGTVNAKNGFGGYTGAKPYYALIRNDQIIRFCITSSDGICVLGR